MLDILINVGSLAAAIFIGSAVYDWWRLRGR